MKGDKQQLVASLFRYAGLSPDPPEEFSNFSDEDGGFAIIEFNIRDLNEKNSRNKLR